jgi:predicted amidohydrolase
MSECFQLVTVQSHFIGGDTAANLGKMEGLVASAMSRHPCAGLLLFPELATSGYDPRPSILVQAEDQDGKSFQRMSKIANKQKVHLAYGYLEDGGSGNIFNSLILLGPDGKMLANYRKIQLTKEEKLVFKAGDSIIIADSELGKIGLLICWDIAFPELSRVLTLGGADIVLVAAAWDKPFARPFMDFARSRALENTIYLATSNHVGITNNVDFFGDSAIIGPDGLILASAGEDVERFASSEIDFDESRTLRDGYFTMLKDRRTDLYEIRTRA